MERSGEVSMPTGQDPIDRLRAADPFRADEVPDASLARVSARIQEHIVTDIQHTSTAAPSRRSFALFGGLVAAGALALAVALGSGFGVQAPIAPTDNPGAGGGIASCLAYDPALLPTFEVAFDGTVTAVDGDQVTFDVNEAWKGVGESVTLTAPATDMALTGPLPHFEVGGRYLVTAAGTTINSCGWTVDYDAGMASDWAAAFAG
jgi:hypothetical protein